MASIVRSFIKMVSSYWQQTKKLPKYVYLSVAYKEIIEKCFNTTDLLNGYEFITLVATTWITDSKMIATHDKIEINPPGSQNFIPEAWKINPLCLHYDDFVKDHQYMANAIFNAFGITPELAGNLLVDDKTTDEEKDIAFIQYISTCPDQYLLLNLKYCLENEFYERAAQIRDVCISRGLPIKL